MYDVKYYLPGGRVEYRPQAARFKYDVWFYVNDELFMRTQVASNRLNGAIKQARLVKLYLKEQGSLPAKRIKAHVSRVYDLEPIEPIDFSFKFFPDGYKNNNADLHRPDETGRAGRGT
jgi:hypothetical protein